MKKFLNNWENVEGYTFEEIQSKVINTFAKWEKSNLIITTGQRERTTSDTYGLPYTSSGSFAGLGCHCNVNAVLKADKNFVIYELAINEDLEIVAYLTDEDDNEKYIVIGRI